MKKDLLTPYREAGLDIDSFFYNSSTGNNPIDPEMLFRINRSLEAGNEKVRFGPAIGNDGLPIILPDSRVCMAPYLRKEDRGMTVTGQDPSLRQMLEAVQEGRASAEGLAEVPYTTLVTVAKPKKLG